MDVLAASANHVVAAENLNLADIPPAATHACAIAAQPDVPRNVTIAVTDGDASITAYTIIINGIDAKGNIVAETFLLAGGLAQTGNIAFATITSVQITVLAGGGVGDTLDVGIGSKLGLSNIIDVIANVYKCTKNAADYSGAGNITPNATYDTVDVSIGGVIVVGDDLTIWYRTNLNLVV